MQRLLGFNQTLNRKVTTSFLSSYLFPVSTFPPDSSSASAVFSVAWQRTVPRFTYKREESMEMKRFDSFAPQLQCSTLKNQDNVDIPDFWIFATPGACNTTKWGSLGLSAGVRVLLVQFRATRIFLNTKFDCCTLYTCFRVKVSNCATEQPHIT